MKRSYWKNYVHETDADEIERNIQRTGFTSSAKHFELIYFEKGKNAPTILISPGSGGHAYVFAELGYRMHLRGYNVFIMPKHGGVTIKELVARHSNAVSHISNTFNDSIFIIFKLQPAHHREPSRLHQATVHEVVPRRATATPTRL